MQKRGQIPVLYYCPLCNDLMEDPVAASDGMTYQRRALKLWLKQSDYSPYTGQKLPNKNILPNRAIKSLIKGLTSKNPQLLKQNQIRDELWQAIKIKEDEMIGVQKKQQSQLAKLKDLQRKLMLQKLAHLQTKKKQEEYKKKQAFLQQQKANLLKQKQKIKKQEKLKNNEKQVRVIKNGKLTIYY